jgi:hypothetical protein
VCPFPLWTGVLKGAEGEHPVEGERPREPSVSEFLVRVALSSALPWVAVVRPAEALPQPLLL